MTSPNAFEQELVALLPRLRRFAYSLARNPAEADDLVQLAAERALRSRDQWQSGTRLDSWCFRILRNCWIDSGRAKSRRQSREATLDEGMDVPDLSASAETKLELQRAMAAMRQLPVDQREVVALILIEGFGYREASEMLDLPIGTVSSRLVRGRTALLRLLGEPTDD